MPFESQPLENTGRTPDRNIETREREPFPLEFYVTDHSADREDTGNPDVLRALYEDIARDGIQSVRYDWRWKNIEPHGGNFDPESLARYAEAKTLMAEAGLKAPTIILSDLPEWARELYKTNKESFFDAYRNYAETVKQHLAGTPGEKVGRVQVLNELNNSVFTPVALEDLPRLFEITRETFQDYNPEMKLMATLLASNTGRLTGTPIEEYLPKLREIKDSFDTVAVDYYPGTWHFPEGRAATPREYFKETVKNTELLEAVFEEIATWGKEYELGEVGMRTNAPIGGSEEAQRYFYDSFFRAFKKILITFRGRGLGLPSRVGLYEAIDEPPQTRMGRLLQKFTPFPEHDLGMRKADGERKLVLQGNRHLPEEGRQQGKSQLGRIIDYLRAPAKRSGRFAVGNEEQHI
jgi:hypothetical protein